MALEELLIIQGRYFIFFYSPILKNWGSPVVVNEIKKIFQKVPTQSSTTVQNQILPNISLDWKGKQQASGTI